MKSLNNFLSAINLASAAEAVIAGERFGLDPKVMIEILNASTGKNSATEGKYPAFILTRTFNSGFFMGLMAKDLRLALELAESTGSPHKLLSDTKTPLGDGRGEVRLQVGQRRGRALSRRVGGRPR